MLFIQSKNLSLALTEAERLSLLDVLRAQDFIPLIRFARRRCFELLVAGHDDAAFVDSMATELEHQCLAEHVARAGEAYTPGELFCLADCILFLVFGADEAAGVSAGVVYRVETLAPLDKLECFCRDVHAAIVEIRRGAAGAAGETPNDLPRWQANARTAQQGLARFMAIQPTDFAVAAKCRSSARELTRASELLAERAVRVFLRRVQEMRREGYTPRRLFAEADRLGGVSVKQMLDAGLLEREVRVSCRKSGHALFDLPSPDALAAITVSKAKCSQCAAPVVDEVVEETINPTWLAVSLLEDGNWLSNRVYKIISALGVPPSELATGPVSAHGESYLAAEVCGNSFLFVTKDGDLTPACSRRIAEHVAETGATHLVVVITGVVEDDGRLRLYEFTWRRARDGQDLNTTFIEGIDEAPIAIERAFQRAVHHELTHKLYTLDAALGANVSNFVLNWFKLLTPTQNANDQRAARLFEAALEHIS
jgi:hypothetical protein